MTKSYAKSLELWQTANHSLVPGSSTLSKHPKLTSLGAYPIYAEKAYECYIEDVDGNSYIDLVSALGTNIIGYNNQVIKSAVIEQIDKGLLCSISNPHCIKLSKQIIDIIPGIEKLRIVKNGSDATTTATRIARAYTKRPAIATCHYHGWHDWCYVGCELGAGIPQSFAKELYSFPYNDLTAVKNLIAESGSKIAAFILEPAQFEAPTTNYLQDLRDLVHANGSLLIFDEVVTGFRFPGNSAQKFFDITPDLSCLGKALGNGYPIAVVGGKANIMNETAHVVSTMTYGEEPLSIVAASKCLEIYQSTAPAEQIWIIGEYFKEQFNDLATKYSAPVSLKGYPSRMTLEYRDSQIADRKIFKTYFLQETATRGVLLGGPIFINNCHTRENLNSVLEVCENIFMELTRKSQITKLDLHGELTEELW